MSEFSLLEKITNQVILSPRECVEVAEYVKGLQSRLDKAHQELHDALHNQVLLNRALAAESRLDECQCALHEFYNAHDFESKGRAVQMLHKAITGKELAGGVERPLPNGG